MSNRFTPLYEKFFNPNNKSNINKKSTSDSNVDITPSFSKYHTHSIYTNTEYKILKIKEIENIVTIFNKNINNSGTFINYNIDIAPVVNYNHFSWNNSWYHINNSFKDIYINFNKFTPFYKQVYKSSIQFVTDINKILYDLKYGNQKNMVKNRIIGIYKSNNSTAIKCVLYVAIASENDVIYYLFKVPVIIYNNNKTKFDKISYVGSGTTDKINFPSGLDNYYFENVLNFGRPSPYGINQSYLTRMFNMGRPFERNLTNYYKMMSEDEANDIYNKYMLDTQKFNKH